MTPSPMNATFFPILLSFVLDACPVRENARIQDGNLPSQTEYPHGILACGALRHIMARLMVMRGGFSWTIWKFANCSAISQSCSATAASASSAAAARKDRKSVAWGRTQQGYEQG